MATQVTPLTRDGGTHSGHQPGFPTYQTNLSMAVVKAERTENPVWSPRGLGLQFSVKKTRKNSFVHLKTAAACKFSPRSCYQRLKRDSGRLDSWPWQKANLVKWSRDSVCDRELVSRSAGDSRTDRGFYCRRNEAANIFGHFIKTRQDKKRPEEADFNLAVNVNLISIWPGDLNNTPRLLVCKSMWERRANCWFPGNGSTWYGFSL